MQGSAPAAGTVRVVTRSIDKREGHVAGVCGLFITLIEALAAPKLETLVILLTSRDK